MEGAEGERVPTLPLFAPWCEFTNTDVLQSIPRVSAPFEGVFV